MHNLKEYILKNKFNIILIFLWTVIVIITVFYHELWLDELLMDYYVRIKGIDFIINEVHPPLWFILQVPFFLIGFPEYPIQFLAFSFMFIAICYFMLKSPFNYFVKSLFIFSCGMLYLLPVIARNYSLIPIFLFVLANLYKERHSKPLSYVLIIVLLSQTHIITWGFCFIVSLFFIIEIFLQKNWDSNNFNKAKNITSVLILCLDLLFLLMYFKRHIAMSLSNLSHGHYELYHFGEIWKLFDYIPIIMGLNSISLYVFIISIILLFICILYINKKSFFILIFTVFSFIFLFNFIYGFYGVPLQKVFCIFLFLIFACWILENNNKIVWRIKEITLSIILIIVFFNPLSFPIVIDDINNSFNNFLKLEDFIKNNINQNQKVLLLFDNQKNFFENREFYKIRLEDYIIKYGINNVKIDNDFVDNYIKDNNLNIKYVIIFKDLFPNIDLKYPYVLKLDSSSNNISLLYYDDLRLQINFYKIFERSTQNN